MSPHPAVQLVNDRQRSRRRRKITDERNLADRKHYDIEYNGGTDLRANCASHGQDGGERDEVFEGCGTCSDAGRKRHPQRLPS